MAIGEQKKTWRKHTKQRKGVTRLSATAKKKKKKKQTKPKREQENEAVIAVKLRV